ncbi:hypothetical protein P4T89_08460 [Bacillus nakamurai]|uniref:Uncharacterized protein n=1 Tax=Bacillus nakamurai TaxID=1793963 RepID=A0A150F5N3_9BACI|nr:hypothetical protein [Bacillus nakamurai]KXZ17721.1 hypothetical protein AXI58_18450 [Bacillus nakamurai]MED1227622.1 hypothetical protein [Bacillus nakamurai]
MEEKEIVILMHKFHTVSQKLLDFYSNDEAEAMRLAYQFINFIENEPIIKEFIDKNNKKQFDIEGIRQNKPTAKKFSLPLAPQDEIAFIYQLLKHGLENFNNYLAVTTYGYAFYKGARTCDRIREFNSEVVSNLAGYISEYLRELHIRATRDHETVRQYVFNSEVKQFNNAEKGNIYAHQINNGDENTKEMLTLTKELIQLLKMSKTNNTEAKEDAEDFLEEVEVSLNNGEAPKQSLIRRTTTALKDVTSTLSAGDSLLEKANQFIEKVSGFFS